MPDSNRDSHWCLLLLLFYWFLLLLSHSAAAALQRQSGAQTAQIHRNAGDRPHPTVGIQHQIHVPGISSSSLPVFCPTVCGHSDLSGPERPFLIWSVMFQDFVHHFHVLLPRGMSPTKSAIRDFFRKVHLPPAGYQVGSTMVCVCVFSWIRPVLKFRSGCWKMLLFVEGVSAGGGASAASDAPPSGGPATDRHTAASLQGHAGEKALCQHETICFYHSGGMFWLEDGEARFEEVLLWLLCFLMVVILPVIFSETTFKPSSSFCS